MTTSDEPYKSRWVESATASMFSNSVVPDCGSTAVCVVVSVAPLAMMMAEKTANLSLRSMMDDALMDVGVVVIDRKGVCVL